MRSMRCPCAAMLLWALLGRSTQASPILSIQPSTLTVAPGQSFALDVDISDVADLYAFQFDLGFDPTVLSGISVSEGAFLPSGGTTFFIAGTIDNVGGTIAFNADSLIGAIPGVTGSGTLATVEFSALGGGSSQVDISNVTLLDLNLDTIAADTVGGVVNVSAVPEPGTMSLLLIASLAAFGLRARSPNILKRQTLP